MIMPVSLQPERLPFPSATLRGNIYTNDILSTSGIVTFDVADYFGTFLVVLDRSADSLPTSELNRIIPDSNITLFKQYLNQTDFSRTAYIHC